MPSVSRALALALALVAAVLAPALPFAVSPSAAAPRDPGGIVGTYERLARDVFTTGGKMQDVYAEFLRTGDRSYRLRLPKGTHLHGGTPVRVRGSLRGQDLEATTVEQLGAPRATATSGKTKVLVILAHWPGKPVDSVTREQAHAQILGDDDGWFMEASYGQLGLTGSTTPWVQIPAPPSDDCFSHHQSIMTNAKTAAKALGSSYDSTLYDRTIVYFPRCYAGDAAYAAGWAYEPGDTAWLNGYMDRRVSIHEQGHNYNLAHAHTLECGSGETRVTLGGSCYLDDYGDQYDAMGSSNHTAHFGAPHKDQLGWLAGRKITLGSGTQTFTLPPYETAGSAPVAALAPTPVASRKYWIEYRRAIGYDAGLPDGATNGVLVHMVDSTIYERHRTDGSYLLDPSPHNPYADAVITPGGAWTSPEGVRISVGAVTASGAEVTVNGTAPPATVPGAPRDVTALGGDNFALVTWDPPASNGGATVTRYAVTRTAPGEPETFVVDAAEGSRRFEGLVNGTQYSFTVAARNSVGTGPASGVVSATPVAQAPSVTVTAPAAGTELTGTTTLAASPLPHPVTQSPVVSVDFQVDGESVASAWEAPWTAEWDATTVADGPHTVTAVVYDERFRTSTSAPVAVTVKAPRPAVAITAPADGATVTADTVPLAATATPLAGSAVQRVEFELSDGTPLGSDWDAPYEWDWNVAAISGARTVVARVFDDAGRSGVSAPVSVTIAHPVPSVSFTAPAAGATVEGDAVPVAAAPVPSPVSEDAIDRVEFWAGDVMVGAAYQAPWQLAWDATPFTGAQTLTAVAYDVAGHSASATRDVFVANHVPSVSVTSPVEGSVVNGATVDVTATAAPNATSNAAVDRVELAVDGEPVAAVANGTTYTGTWNVAKRYGAHTVTATVFDTAGQSAVSSVGFTVPYPAPSAVVVAPAAGATVRPGPVGVAAAAAPDVVSGVPVVRADFFADGSWIGDDTDPSDGLTLEWQASRGTYDLTVTVTDEDGWSGTSAASSVTVADLPGAPTAVTATAGLDGTATVAWQPPASDGGSPVTGYVVRTGTVTKDAAGSPFTFTGLTNRTAYSFSVAAKTAAGTGAFSAPSPPVTPGPPTLSIAATPATVAYGGTVTVTGALRDAAGAGIAGRTVQLLTCVRNTTTCKAVTGKTAVTAATTGAVRITYVPAASTDLRLRFTQSGGLPTTTSAQRFVTVAATVSIATNKTSMPLGGTATVTGAVKPAHSGRAVYLQRLYGTGWRNGPYKYQGTTGAVSFGVKPTARGTYYYRLHFPADADHAAGYSAKITLKVT